MKRIIVTLVVVAAFAAALVAQERASGEKHRIADFLNLSADQAVSWESAERALHTTVEPLFAQQRATHEQIESMLGANADACAIGSLQVKAYGVGQQIKAAHQNFEKTVDGILTPEQRTKFAALRASREMHERRPFPEHP